MILGKPFSHRLKDFLGYFCSTTARDFGLTHRKPSVLLVADVAIRPYQSGASVLLWRQQQRLKSFELVKPSAPGSSPHPLLTAVLNLGNRLHLIRLLYFLQPVIQRYGMRLEPEQAAEVRRRRSAILTVAQRLAWIDAMGLARATGIPLVTIFHDWYPDASGCARGFTRLWDSAFRRLYRRTDLLLCVTESMRRELGPHPNAHMLPTWMASPAPCAPPDSPTAFTTAAWPAASIAPSSLS